MFYTLDQSLYVMFIIAWFILSRKSAAIMINRIKCKCNIELNLSVIVILNYYFVISIFWGGLA